MSCNFFPAQIPSGLQRMALCSTTAKTRTATRPAHPPQPVLAPSFSTLQQSPPRTPAASRISTRPPTRDVTSHADPTMPCPCAAFFCPLPRHATGSRAMLSPLLRFSSACPLLSLPSPVPSPPLELPPASARPGLSLSMCQVPAETRRPSVPPSWATLQTTVRLVLPPSPPPWYHLTASPAGNPPGYRPGDAVHWPKTSLSHLVNSTAPLSSSSPLAAHSLPNIRSYTRAPKIMIGVA